MGFGSVPVWRTARVTQKEFVNDFLCRPRDDRDRRGIWRLRQWTFHPRGLHPDQTPPIPSGAACLTDCCWMSDEIEVGVSMSTQKRGNIESRPAS